MHIYTIPPTNFCFGCFSTPACFPYFFVPTPLRPTSLKAQYVSLFCCHRSICVKEKKKSINQSIHLSLWKSLEKEFCICEAKKKPQKQQFHSSTHTVDGNSSNQPTHPWLECMNEAGNNTSNKSSRKLQARMSWILMRPVRRGSRKKKNLRTAVHT